MQTPCPCEQTPNNCYEVTPCECAVKDLKTSCLISDSESIPCLPIAKGVNFNEWKRQLILKVCAKIDAISVSATNLVNIGSGQGVYKDINLLGQRTLKSIRNLGSLITITSDADSVIVGLSEANLTAFVQNLAVAPTPQVLYEGTNVGTNTAVNIFRDKTVASNTATFNFRRLKSPNSSVTITQVGDDIDLSVPLPINYNAENIGVTGAEVYASETGTNTSTFSFRKIKSVPLGAGVGNIEVLDNIIANGNEIEVRAKTLTSTSLNITDQVVLGVPTGRILIEIPVDVNSRTFYVKENSLAIGEFGTQSKPYKTLKAAMVAYIGTGTEIAPQFAFIGKIELLSDVILPSNTGDTNYIAHLSANHLNIEGNGYRIEYNGAEPYFISTKRLNTLAGLSTSTSMTFTNVLIESKTQHRIMEHEAFSNGASGLQNTATLKLENVTLIDSAHLTELSSYTDTGTLLFGLKVFVQNTIPLNTLPENNYVFKVLGKNWNGVTNLQSSDLKITGSSMGLLYIENASISIGKLTLNYNPFYRNYQTFVSGVYSAKENLFALKIKNCTFLQIGELLQTSTVQSISGKYIGGMGSFIKAEGINNIYIRKGNINEEKVKSLISVESVDTGTMTFENFNTTPLQIENTAFEISGTPIVQKTVYINGSTINKVAYFNGTLSTVKPTAISAQVNGYNFTSSPPFANNTAATAGGLVQGNIYFNTTTGSNTTVI